MNFLNKNNIPEYWKKIKTNSRLDIILIIVIWLVGLVFFMSFLIYQNKQHNKYIVNSKEEGTELTIFYPSDYKDRLEPVVVSAESALFVASKNGEKYYPINCKSANRIKPENRTYFSTEDEAKSMGLTRSSTCSF